MPDADDTTTTDLAETEVTESANPDAPTEDAPDDGDTFPRTYVEKLRGESAGYRDRAKLAEARADELARALFTARVEASGRLADATDLEFIAETLDDADKLAEAIDGLIAAKPHLKARKVSGSVGQGERGEPAAEFSLLDRLRGNP